jgi:hypothetical protein
LRIVQNSGKFDEIWLNNVITLLGGCSENQPLHVVEPSRSGIIYCRQERFQEHPVQNALKAFAAAAALAVAGPALAQTAGATMPAPAGVSATPPAAAASPGMSASPGASASTEAAAPAAPTAAASVTSGMTVKDKTGAPIGQVAEVKAGADGQPVATIKMDDKTFAVATASLGVSGGAATINATKAEVAAMMAQAR